MIAGLVALLVAAVVAVVVFALIFAALGLVIGGAVALTVLAVKLAPVILVGWLAVKLLGGGRCCRARPLPRARVSEDDAWLDSRA
jgi:hypothetical protein